MSIIDEQVIHVTPGEEIPEIYINRPNHLNALNSDVLQGLILSLDVIQKRNNVRAVIITGTGEKAFVAGADIASMSQLGPRPIAEYVELGQRTMRAFECFPVPVIAAINGFALGGGLELALACDVIFAAQTAKVGQPEVNLGIIPGFGGTQRLITRCGIGTARKLIYSGELITADEALRLGIVDKVCEPAQLMTEARAYAALVASKGPLAVREAKKVIRESQEAMLLSGLRKEVESFNKLFTTADREEGMQAFLQKRPAKFRAL